MHKFVYNAEGAHTLVTIAIKVVEEHHYHSKKRAAIAVASCLSYTTF